MEEPWGAWGHRGRRWGSPGELGGALDWCALSSRIALRQQDKCGLEIHPFPQRSLSAGNLNSVKLNYMKSKEERGEKNKPCCLFSLKALQVIYIIETCRSLSCFAFRLAAGV